MFGQFRRASVERLGAVLNIGITGGLLFDQVLLVDIQAVGQFVHQVAALVLLEKLLADARRFGNTVDTGVNHIGHFPASDSTDDSAGDSADSGTH